MKPIMRTEETQLAAHIAGLEAWLRDVGSRPGAIPDVVARVKALQAAAAAGPVSVEDACRIWNNPGRYRLRCNGCDTWVPAVVTVGQEPDYESSTADLCKTCLLAALALFDGGK